MTGWVIKLGKYEIMDKPSIDVDLIKDSIPVRKFKCLAEIDELLTEKDKINARLEEQINILAKEIANLKIEIDKKERDIAAWKTMATDFRELWINSENESAKLQNILAKVEEIRNTAKTDYQYAHQMNQLINKWDDKEIKYKFDYEVKQDEVEE